MWYNGLVNGVNDMYQLIENNLSYGIKYSGNGQRIDDLSFDKQRVQDLVDLCNQLQLDPVHLFDVVDDFMFEEGLVRA